MLPVFSARLTGTHVAKPRALNLLYATRRGCPLFRHRMAIFTDADGSICVNLPTVSVRPEVDSRIADRSA